jgi:hypothetical protein
MSFPQHRSGGRSPAPRRVRPTLEPLETRLVPATVTNHHGPVLKHVEVEAVFLGAAWQTDPALAQAAAGLQAFLRDMTGGTYLSQLTRAGYGVGHGSLVGSWTDPVALPPVMDETAVQDILRPAIAAGTLPPPDKNRLYFVFIQPGIEVLFAGDDSETGGLLGFHSDTRADSGSPFGFAVVPYGSTAARQTLPGLSPFEAATNAASHELAEGVTDPLGFHVGRGAWEDRRKGGGEIADLAGGFFYDLDGYVVSAVVNRQERLIFASGHVLDPRALTG